MSATTEATRVVDERRLMSDGVSGDGVSVDGVSGDAVAAEGTSKVPDAEKSDPGEGGCVTDGGDGGGMMPLPVVMFKTKKTQVFARV